MKMLRLAFVLLLFRSPTAFAEALDALPSVDQVRQHLNDWRKDFAAFRIRYQVKPPDGSRRIVRDFLMTRTGDYLDADESLPCRRVVKGGNARVQFEARYSSRHENESFSLYSVEEEVRRANSLGSSLSICPIYLLLDARSGRWMDDYGFSEWDVQVVGREFVDDESCLVLNLHYLQNEEDLGHGSRVWLAEEKDFLIKKVMPYDEEPSGGWDQEYLCSEYRQFGHRWYPHSGRMYRPEDHFYWEVLEFEGNPTTIPEMFVPPPNHHLINGRPRRALSARRKSKTDWNSLTTFSAATVVMLAAGMIVSRVLNRG